MSAPGPRPAERWREPCVIALVALLYLGFGVSDHAVWSPTEPAVSGVVWNMVAHGSFAIPRINDLPYLEKPPLYYWLAWLACEASGELDAGCLRLPAALAGVACLLLVHGICRQRFGAPVACVTTLLAATTPGFYVMAHRAAADILTILAVYLCFAIFVHGLPRDGERAGARPVAHDVAFSLALALSFYAKNFFTFLVVLPPVTLFLLMRRELGRLVRVGALVTALTALAVAPWAAALFLDGGWEPLRVVFVDNTVGRFLSLSPEGLDLGPLNDAYDAERGTSPLLYLALLPLLPAPWSLLFVGGLVGLLRRRPRGDLARFLALAVATIPLVLSLSASRAANYLDPLRFVAFLIIGDSLHALLHGAREVSRAERGLAVANLGLAAAAFPLLPIALAVWFGDARFLAPGILGLALVAGVWLRFRPLRLEWRPVYALGCAVALAFLATLPVAIGRLDADKSSEPFFRAIESELEGRELYATFVDDHGLPLLTCRLERRLAVVRDPERMLELLSGDAPVGLFVKRNLYERSRERFERVPHRVQIAPSGKRSLLLVTNL